MRAIVSFAFLLTAPFVHAAEIGRTDALVKLCEVWSTVKFLDPQLLSRDVDWDEALLRAIPRVREARTEEELAKAMAPMLAELGDPLTRVAKKMERPKTGGEVELIRRDGDMLFVNLGPYGDVHGGEALFDARRNAARELATAKSVIFDLRTNDDEVYETAEWLIPSTGGLVTEPVPGIARRIVMHSGFAPQVGGTSGGYYSGLLTIAGAGIGPGLTPVKSAPRVVFVTRDRVPEAALAMRQAGKAAIVSEQPLDETMIGWARTIEIGDGWSAHVRTAETTASGFGVDAVVAPGGNDATMKRAVEIARAETSFATHDLTERAVAVHAIRDAPYAEPRHPDLPHRVLALFRYWSVIDRFYPYKHLIGDWSSVLREHLPSFEDAKDEREYAMAVLALVARVEDGHSGVYGDSTNAVFGGLSTLPLEVRAVEGQYVVTAKGEKADGVAVGDVVVSIDGEALDERVKRFHPLLTASHEVARLNRILRTALRGAKDSVGELVLRGADGTIRKASVSRVDVFVPPRTTGDPWRMLDGGIGYVDLTRLTVSQVGPMFDALGGATTIVFDMRGYPNGTAWSIAPRLNTRNAKVGATFRRRQVMAWSAEEGASSYSFEQPLPESKEPKYTGRTVMLIDDRAGSQAEHTGLFFKAANGTTFIGSRSTGTNGDVTNVVLPGGIVAFFSGHDVRHSDGRQLQRIGIVPDVAVTPTLQGIRSAKDEVLERAIRYVNEGK